MWLKDEITAIVNSHMGPSSVMRSKAHDEVVPRVAQTCNTQALRSLAAEWLSAHRCGIIQRIYWLLICGHETGSRDFWLTKKGMSPAALSSSIIFFNVSPLTAKFLSVETFFIVTPPIRAARSTEEWDCETGSKSVKHHWSVYQNGYSDAGKVAGSCSFAFYCPADKDLCLRQTWSAGHVNALKVRVAPRLIPNPIT